MALKNRLGTGVFIWEGSQIKLQASFDNLKSLGEATGEEPLLYLGDCSHPMNMTEVFFHLQHGSAYSREEIYAAFFGKLVDFENPEFTDAIQTMFNQLAGKDLAEKIKPADKDTKKKTNS